MRRLPLGNGVYTVGYRIVSRDGHVVQGSYQFTVADPAETGAVVVTPSGAAGPVSASPSDGGVPAPVLVGLLVLAVALAAGAVFTYRRRRSPASDVV